MYFTFIRLSKLIVNSNVQADLFLVMVIGEFGMVKQAQTYPEWLQPISYPNPISGLDIRPTLQI